MDCQFANVSVCRQQMNDLMWEWFEKMRGQNIPVSGPLMQQKTLIIAQKLHLTEFKASTGDGL